jgi:hypothetical protein
LWFGCCIGEWGVEPFLFQVFEIFLFVGFPGFFQDVAALEGEKLRGIAGDLGVGKYTVNGGEKKW